MVANQIRAVPTLKKEAAICSVVIIGEMVTIYSLSFVLDDNEYETISIWIALANKVINFVALLVFFAFACKRKSDFKQIFTLQCRNSFRMMMYVAVLYMTSVILYVYFGAWMYVLSTRMEPKSKSQLVVLQYMYEILFDVVRAAVFVPPKGISLVEEGERGYV